MLERERFDRAFAVRGEHETVRASIAAAGRRHLPQAASQALLEAGGEQALALVAGGGGDLAAQRDRASLPAQPRVQARAALARGRRFGRGIELERLLESPGALEQVRDREQDAVGQRARGGMPGRIAPRDLRRDRPRAATVAGLEARARPLLERADGEGIVDGGAVGEPAQVAPQLVALVAPHADVGQHQLAQVLPQVAEEEEAVERHLLEAQRREQRNPLEDRRAQCLGFAGGDQRFDERCALVAAAGRERRPARSESPPPIASISDRSRCCSNAAGSAAGATSRKRGGGQLRDRAVEVGISS